MMERMDVKKACVTEKLIDRTRLDTRKEGISRLVLLIVIVDHLVYNNLKKILSVIKMIEEEIQTNI